MSVSTLQRSEATVVRFTPRGAAAEAFTRRDGELVLSGPAGTGKTRSLLEKVHLCASLYPGMRALLIRKTHSALSATALVTWQRKVLHPLDEVRFYGGSAVEPPQFQYPNGSRVMVGGLDNPTKVMSGEYDLIYVNEATELSEHDWEALTTRLRHGRMPSQQILGDCNPDAPTHWLKKRADRGQVVMLESRHEDNPVLWDDKAGAWTEAGAEYIAKLEALTGVRYLRLRKGIWAAAEGLVYEGWDPAIHLIDRLPLPADVDAEALDPLGIPLAWPRYWAIDFGYTHPFVWQLWTQDGDGRLYLLREIYATQRLVQDHAAVIRQVTEGQPLPAAVVCDHDAEDRATLERHLHIVTLPAKKSISPGLQAVQARLRAVGDGKPRLFVLRGALVERDLSLADAGKPTRTEDEFPTYVWDTSGNRRKGEAPVDADNHGMDALRYMVAHCDIAGAVSYAPSLWG